MRRVPSPTVLMAVFAVAAVACAGLPPSGECLVRVGDHLLRAEVASSPPAQLAGLSGRETLPEGRGMLFVFPERKVRTFWMKEMRFDLDIIWIDGDRVVGVEREVPAEGTCPERSYSSPVPADLVLEVPAGWAGRHGIRTGDRVTLQTGR